VVAIRVNITPACEGLYDVQLADESPARAFDSIGARRATPDDLARLYAARGSTFVAVAAGICGDGAQDAVHDAFVRALVRLGSLRSRGALEGWVWRIVLNEARRRTRSRRPDDAPAETEAAAAERVVDARAVRVRALVARLPRRQREVVFLRYFADLDEASIAAALGIRRGTVAATLHRVHVSMRTALDQGGLEP
jgi:RNA polymerase sigma factor (sigma-70 family)